MSRIPMLQDLVMLLEEMDDWANEHGVKILEKITQFKQSLKTQDTFDLSVTSQHASSTIQPAKRPKGIRFTMIHTPKSFSTSM